MPTLFDSIFPALAVNLLGPVGLGLAATYRIPNAGATFSAATRNASGGADEDYTVRASPPGPLQRRQGAVTGSQPAGAEEATAEALITPPALPTTRSMQTGHLLVYSGATYRIVGHEPYVSGDETAAVRVWLAGTTGAPT